MHQMNQLARWFFAILKKGLWVLGLVPTVAGLVTAVVPIGVLPPAIRSMLQGAADWQWTLVLVTAALLISAFLVHLDDARIAEGLSTKLGEVADTQPRIAVGFMDPAGNLVKRLPLQLQALPPTPDFDALVAQRRSELSAKFQQALSSSNSGMAGLFPLVFHRQRYDQQCEEYLTVYRRCLVQDNDCRLAAARARAIPFMCENRGRTKAGSVVIELQLPVEWSQLPPHVRTFALFVGGSAQLARPTSEQVKLASDAIWHKLPPEPEVASGPSIGLPDGLMLWDRLVPSRLAEKQAPSHTAPEIRQKGGSICARYSPGTLIPHDPVCDLEPLWVWLGDMKEVSQWNIGVTIFSEDLAESQADTLTLDISVMCTADARADGT